MEKGGSDDGPLQPRIVHLLGGLRAIDLREDKVLIQIALERPLIEFATPKYPQLYSSLKQLGLTPIGVEFPHTASLKGLSPSDWQCFFPTSGFLLMDERRAWSEIRYLAIKEGKFDVVEVAANCTTYLDLLDIRLMQLSVAYNASLRSQNLKTSEDNFLFSNGFMREIDAAIHGFVADTGSFRDHIAETVWHHILEQSEPLGTFSSFLKKIKTNLHKVAVQLSSAGQKGEWLYNFSTLRNEIVHVAPVGRSSEFHFCQLRNQICDPSLTLPFLHYPILDSDNTVWTADDGKKAIYSQDEAAIKAALKQYSNYVENSLDGLAYASQTLEHMVKLIRDVRVASGWKGKIPTLTDADIVGDVEIIS